MNTAVSSQFSRRRATVERFHGSHWPVSEFEVALSRHAAVNARRNGWLVVACVAEVAPVSEIERVRALTEAGLVHPSPEAVTSAVFTAPSDFFLPMDKVQVKYEMLRAHAVDGVSA